MGANFFIFFWFKGNINKISRNRNSYNKNELMFIGDLKPFQNFNIIIIW